MKTGLTISALIHVALLLWGVISFAARPLEAKPNDALPIDIISDKQFSELTRGVKNGAKDKPPAPFVEKIGDPNPVVDDSTAKVTEKKELVAVKTDAPPPPADEPAAKPAEAKPEKKEPPKIDPIAETLKKEDAKRKAEERARAKAAQQLAKQPQFDPTKIAALLDKREPMRQASAGQDLSSAPALGKSDGNAATLSQSEIDAMRRRLGECWNPPAGARDAGQLKVVLRVMFKPDATVATPPQLVAASASPFGPAMAESAKRAILTCQPFTMLRVDNYHLWKDIEITFDPRDMFGG
ncbi:MAG TPA: protein TolA [Bradyrhizobium sp.]|nr:protein TolA [Bradyrhizobium sp.]